MSLLIAKTVLMVYLQTHCYLFERPTSIQLERYRDGVYSYVYYTLLTYKIFDIPLSWNKTVVYSEQMLRM